MQGTRFEPWSGKIPHAAGQVGLCTTTAEPERPGASAPQQEKPLQWEAHFMRSNRDPVQKIKKERKKKKKKTTPSACLSELTQNLTRISKDLVKLGYGRRQAYQGKVYLETDTCPDKPEFSLKRDRESGKWKRMELREGTGSEKDRRKRLGEVRGSYQSIRFMRSTKRASSVCQVLLLATWKSD